MLLMLQAVADTAGASGGAWGQPWLQVIEIVVIAGSVGLVWVQIRKNHQWNRRKASHDFLYKLTSGDFRKLRETLEYELGVRYRNDQQTYADVKANLESDRKQRQLYVKSSSLFNFFEQMAVSIKNGVLEEDICFDQIHHVLCEYRRWGQPLIEERSPEGYRSTWIEFVSLADGWEEKIEDSETRAEELQQEAEKEARRRARQPGRGPL